MSAQSGHDEHRYALLDGALLDASALAAGQAGEIRAASQAGRLACPVCREPLIAKLGEVVAWHFAHRADSEYRWHEPESDPHKKAKRLLAGHALELWPGAEVREEWRLPQIRQIADVLAAPAGRPAVVLEIQYADLSGASFRDRHGGYQSLGIHDVWVLGHTRLRAEKGTAVLDSLASAIAGTRQPLLYLNPKTRKLTWVQVPPAAVFAAARGERIGRTAARIVKAPLSALRMDGARPFLAAPGA